VDRVRLRRTGDMNVDIQDRRGRSLPAGAAVGGGVGGLATIIIALLLGTGQCSSGGGLGNLGLPSGFDQGDVGAGAASGVTCDTQTAKLVCDATTSVQDFWTDEAPRALGVPYRRTQTVFFSGATQTGCGPASSQTGPFYCPADQLVYIDLDFLDQLQSQFGAQGDFATAYITAHEYGHHIQDLEGVSQQVSDLSQRQPSRANELSIRLELQADCLAGVWGASVKDQLDPGDLEEGLHAAAAVGDDRIQLETQGRTDPETWNHGSSADRQSWFRRGAQSGNPSSCDTFAADAPITSIQR
jgi:predicted metalloprotease